MDLSKNIFLVGLFICFCHFPTISAATQLGSGQNQMLISSKELAREINLARNTSLFEQIKIASEPLGLIQQIKDSSSLSLASKEFLLFELAKMLKNIDLQQSEAALHLLAGQAPILKTALSDGHHQQIVIAFPISNAARASLNYLKSMQLAEELLTLVQDANYAMIEMTPAFLKETKNQTVILRSIAGKLTQQQAESFIDWSLSRNDIKVEAKLIIAMRANDKDAILTLLHQEESVPLHHYIDQIMGLWPKSHYLEVIEKISLNKNYASQVSYHVTNLDIDTNKKLDFWIKQLSQPNVSASAAHSLAKNMSFKLADRLAEYASRTGSPGGQRGAVLALSLSQHDYATQQLQQLVKQKSLPQHISKEIEKW